MSEPVHASVPSRSTRERITTSCGECRRRKQKCSQGQPCTNCARRFPQPVCEYKPVGRRRNPPGVSSHPTFTVALRSTADHQPAATDAPLEAPARRWLKHRGRGHTGLDRGGQVAMWSGVNMATHYPSAVSLNRLVNFDDQSQSHALHLEDLSRCNGKCTRHSQLVRDALLLIASRVNIAKKFLVPWTAASQPDLWPLIEYYVTAHMGSMKWKVVGGDFDSLPMVPSKQNWDLLNIFLKLLSRYKTSLDGNPGPDDPIIKSYYPFCIQNPLMLQITLYTSACFLNETGHMPKMGFMAYKGTAIRMLNENLRSTQHQTDDAAIAGVIQLILDEWYWGDTDDLKAHMRGLREMIRMRGGFQYLGMDGLLAKMVIAYDTGIAIAHETKPFLGDGIEFDFRDPRATPFQISHNTPLVYDLPDFRFSAQALGLHDTTVSILNDVRSLINDVMSLPENPSPQDLQKIASISAWMYARINTLPVNSPEDGHADENSVFPANEIMDDGAAVAIGPICRKTVADKILNPQSKDSPETCSDSGTVESSSYGQHEPEGVSRESGSSPSGFQDVAARQDFIYRVIRVAALVTVRAIRDRKPVSEACTSEEFLQVWTTSWRVPLTTWRGMIGIFNWAMVSIVPLSHGGAHERFARTMFMISMVSRAVEDWGVFIEASTTAMRLQAWLTGAWGRGEENIKAGGAAVARHGFLNPGWE